MWLSAKMKDWWLNMRHLDIKGNDIKKQGYELSEYMVTISSNNFGDQVLDLKKYNDNIILVLKSGDKYKASGYEIIKSDYHPENNHLTDKQITLWAKAEIIKDKGY